MSSHTRAPHLPTAHAGGDFSNVFKWIIENGGVSSDAAWPYLARETRCHNRMVKKCVWRGLAGAVLVWLWGSLRPRRQSPPRAGALEPAANSC